MNAKYIQDHRHKAIARTTKDAAVFSEKGKTIDTY